MGEVDLREENARLKAQLHKVQQVCALHRKLGEDTEFEIRELKRKLEHLTESIGIHVRHYDALSDRIMKEGSTELRIEFELCATSIKMLKDLLSRIENL